MSPTGNRCPIPAASPPGVEPGQRASEARADNPVGRREGALEKSRTSRAGLEDRRPVHRHRGHWLKMKRSGWRESDSPGTVWKTGRSPRAHPRSSRNGPGEWSRRRESNPPDPPYHGGALPREQRRHTVRSVGIEPTPPRFRRGASTRSASSAMAEPPSGVEPPCTRLRDGCPPTRATTA
jgi:hypothetical protein